VDTNYYIQYVAGTMTVASNFPCSASTGCDPEALSCPTTTFCMAVGETQSQNEDWASTYNGTAWSNNATFPAIGTYNRMAGVSCPSITVCEAVGFEYNGSTYETMAFGWNGSTWTQQTTTNPSANGNMLQSISCPTTTYCVAVGYQLNAGLAQGYSLAEQWSGGVWSTMTTVNGALTTYALYSVSCTATTFCMATGNTASSTGYYQTLAEKWSSGAWSMVTTTNPTTNYDYLNGVSCASTTFCVGIGTYQGASGPLPLGEVYAGASFATSSPPDPGGTNQENQWDAISCPSTSFCMAAGGTAATSAGPWSNASAEYSSGSWSLPTTTTPSGGTSDPVNPGLYIDSCTSSSFCVAGGHFAPSSGSPPERSFTEQWGASWAATMFIA